MVYRSNQWHLLVTPYGALREKKANTKRREERIKSMINQK